MKVTVNPGTGAMEFDASPEEAVALMKLQQEMNDAVETAVEVAEQVAAADESGLTRAQYVVWEYLVQHENSPDGVTCAAVARAVRITNVAASGRCQTLVEKGFAERLSRGRYKAVCP